MHTARLPTVCVVGATRHELASEIPSSLEGISDQAYSPQGGTKYQACPPQTERQTPVKTLPSTTSLVGGKNIR